MPKFTDRLSHAWNSFFAVEAAEQIVTYQTGPSSTYRPDRTRLRVNAERTILASILTRIANDVSQLKIEHVKLDDNGHYERTIDSGLNNCLNVEANLDQAATHFRLDMALSLLSEGCIAVLPVDTTINPKVSSSYDIKTMRVGTVVQWWPEFVRVRAYNERKGIQEEVTVHKSTVAIIENPFYTTMNEPNSTLQRLIHKLSMLDNIDEITSSGKLDLIIQLPYQVKGEIKTQQAENRLKSIQDQLVNNTYGIAYTDGTEKVIQLNRAVTNNLLEQVEALREELYDELGITADIMNGTADDVAMNNYINRVVEPIVVAIVENLDRKFITKTARTQGQTIMYFQTPFKLIPISELANLVDVLSRNQVVTPNEVRPSLGLKPSKEPQANQLINSNMPLSEQVTGYAPNSDPADIEEANLDSAMADLGI